jgi:activator of HSP90 ATPase
VYITKKGDGVPIVNVEMVLGFWDEYYFSIAKVSGHVALF